MWIGESKAEKGRLTSKVFGLGKSVGQNLKSTSFQQNKHDMKLEKCFGGLDHLITSRSQSQFPLM